MYYVIIKDNYINEDNRLYFEFCNLNEAIEFMQIMDKYLTKEEYFFSLVQTKKED